MEVAIPSFEWRNVRFNPTIVIRKDSKDLQSMLDDSKVAVRKAAELIKEGTNLKNKISKEKDLDKKKKLANKLKDVAAELEKVQSKFWELFDNAGSRLRRICIQNLTLFHRTRNDINVFIKMMTPLQDEELKAKIIAELNGIKSKAKKALRQLWLNSKSNEREILNPKLLREALSLQRTFRLLTLIRRATIDLDNFQGIIQNVRGILKPGKLAATIKQWKEQIEDLEEMGERIKVVIHRQHLMANKVGGNQVARRRFKKNLEAITANTRTLYTDINISHYTARRVA